jgi:hydroxymethylglutaryl-CoA lyase
MTDNHITIYEVGPRDGLQNEAALISTANKIALIDCLSAAGLSKIETTSFVSPKWVPQMADAAKVMAGISRNPSVDYAALTPNLKGLDAAIHAQADEVAIFGSASETFSQKNINCSIAESIERFKPLAQKALQANVKLRGYVSCVVECPYEGKIKPADVLEIVNRLFEIGCYEVSLGDTIGKATPDEVKQLLDILTPELATHQLAGHFHDTGGNAVENVITSLPYGLRTFDSAIGGLGGCPYAPGAKGNVSTISLVKSLRAAGWETGLDMAELEQAQRLVGSWKKGGSI